MENKWEVKEWGDESYALTNGTITIVTADASCEHYLQAIVDLINGSGYRFHSENNLELDQYLEIEALKAEIENLKQAEQTDKSQFIKDYKQYKENLKYLGGKEDWTQEKVNQMNKVEIFEAIKGFSELIIFLDSVICACEEGAKDWEERALKAEAQQAVWVKASEPDIKEGDYIAKYLPGGMDLAHPYVGMAFVRKDYVRYVCPDYYDLNWPKGHEKLQYIQILDESSTSNYSSLKEENEALKDKLSIIQRGWLDLSLGLENQNDELKEKAAKMEAALRQIEKWQLPETGRFWDKEETQPMSFEACAGSNGAREYIRNVARQALEWEKEEGNG
jgi:hypothetical protein